MIAGGDEKTGGDRCEPLARAVRQSLGHYLEQLNGHDPDDLHRLVIEEVERPLFDCVMQHCDGNQTRAARVLGINRSTLRKKLRQYELLGEE